VLRFVILALVFLLASLSASHASGNTSLDCQSPFNIPRVLLTSRLVIFGETHGTQETPAAVVAFVCEKLNRGDSVSLVLEISADEQYRINQYLSSAGGAADAMRLLAGSFWKRPLVAGRSIHDGRASVAMFELIEAARRMSSQTGRLSVVAGAAYKIGQDPDDMLSTAITEALAGNRNETVVALMGDLHASTTRGNPWNNLFEGVGYRLRELRPEVIHTRHKGGPA
jgi:hypothetical protein